jgi:hypothetical protein
MTTSTQPTETATEVTTSFAVHAVPIGAFAEFDAVAADDEARAIAALLAPYGGVEGLWDPTTTERDKTWVDEQLHRWAKRDHASSSVLVWIGHGESDDTDAWLASFRTERGWKGSGHSPAELATHLDDEWSTRRNDPGAWALVVIEACGAETFVDQLNVSSGGPDGAKCIALIGAGGKGRTSLGTVPKALKAALGSYTDNDHTIRISDLVGQIEDRMDSASVITRGLGRARPLRRPRDFTQGVTAPQDIYDELKAYVAGLPADQRAHFVPKAQGAEQGELAWYFVGRATERREVAAWLAGNHTGLLVVTGPAGSGKSALLGNILVHTTPDLRDLLVQVGQIEPLPPEEQPADDVFDAVVSLTGLSTADLVTRLVAATGLETQTTGLEISERVEHLLTALASRTAPFAVLADALDEAQDPLTVAGAVIRRVAAVPGCRVVVGTRRSTHEGPGLPEPTDTNLLDALGGAGRHATVTVGLDPVAVAIYVQQRLGAARSRWPNSLGIRDAAVSAVAKLVGDKNRQFLYARLAVHEILARPELLTPGNREALTDLLAQDYRALFAAAVRRLAAVDPVFDPLLEALAFTQGRGLPRADRIWATVASALADDRPVTETDLDNVLNAAAPYIMLDGEDGQSVYRLAHRTFQEYFLTRPQP